MPRHASASRGYGRWPAKTDLLIRQWDFRRPGDNTDIGAKTRTVTRTIPGGFGGVPSDDAPPCGTDRGTLLDRAGTIAIDGHFLAVELENFSRAGRDGRKRFAFRRGQAGFHQVIGIVGVFLHVIPGAAFELLARRRE